MPSFNERRRDQTRVKKNLDDSGEKTICVRKMCNTLTSHIAAQKQELCPILLNGDQKAWEEAHETFEVHHLVKVLLSELCELDPDGDRWAAKTSVLSELVAHHVEEKEENIFTSLRRLLNKDGLRECDERFEEDKKVQQVT